MVKKSIFQKNYSSCRVESGLRIVKVWRERTVRKTIVVSKVACTRVLAVKRWVVGVL